MDIFPYGRRMSRKPIPQKSPPGWLRAIRASLKRHIDEVKAEEKARALAADELERIRRHVKHGP